MVKIQICMKSALIFLFATMLYAQEVIEQELPMGSYKQLRKQNREVSRSFICGAGVWKKKMQPPTLCWTQCIMNYNFWGRPGCEWKTICQGNPHIARWSRINGIKFQYCHFQNWNNQISLEDTGNQEWQGMQMCPQNQYVYGMRTKLSDRDGLAGLILLCRNMKTAKQTSQKLVFDGEGKWTDSVLSSNFAYGYKPKCKDNYITGLSLAMAQAPYIFAFNFKYQFPKSFNTAPNQIENIIVYNYGPTEMRKEIEFSKERQFQRTWQNDKGYLHGTSMSSITSQSTSITYPTLEQTSQQQSMTQSRRQESMENFKFGTTQTYRIGQKQKDIVFIPACTKYMIKQIVYSTDADVPYVLQIGYTNGLATEYETINGVYRGVTTGQAETVVTHEKLC